YSPFIHSSHPTPPPLHSLSLHDALPILILPLYNTEIHYIVRADSPLNYLHDIKNAKINGGVLGSGAALITHTLYRMMFNGPIERSEEHTSELQSRVDLVCRLLLEKKKTK